MGKINIFKRAIQGELIKIRSKLFWKFELASIKAYGSTANAIVSLTSYGDRVNDIVPYTILSLLKQTVRPQKIVLWLNEEKWNNENVPRKLKELLPYGLVIKFCKDVRSYTKLVYSIKEFGQYPIITVDDDLFYPQCFIEELYTHHLSYPNKIIVENFCIPAFNNDNNILPYKQWKEYHKIIDDTLFSPLLIFPQGFGGVLYPPNCLHDDVTKEELFLKYAPFADDIWFYIMGLLKGTEKKPVIKSNTTYYFLDLFRQISTHDRLHDLNVGESKNDTQLRSLLSFYNINLKDYE